MVQLRIGYIHLIILYDQALIYGWEVDYGSDPVLRKSFEFVSR